MNKIGVISTFPPTQCGIATYATDLFTAVQQQKPNLEIVQFSLTFNNDEEPKSEFEIRNNHPEDFYKAAELINSLDLDFIDIQHEYKIYGKPDGENIGILLDRITKPIATTLHTINKTLSNNRERIFRKLVERSNVLFVFSKEASDFIITNYGISNDKIQVIPHGVPEIPFILPQDSILRKSCPDRLTFISCGLMRETKGYEIAIEALHSLKDDLGDFQYIIIGADHPENLSSKTYRAKLIDQINRLNLQSNITLINRYLELPQLIEYIQSADICLLPYTREESSRRLRQHYLTEYASHTTVRTGLVYSGSLNCGDTFK